jgi:cytochrome bd-type quinol oxidase subunit 2
MQRRLIYAILIIVIIILLANLTIDRGANASILSTLNGVAVFGFTLLLLYKMWKFREFDQKVQAVQEQHRDGYIMAAMDADELELPEKW